MSSRTPLKRERIKGRFKWVQRDNRGKLVAILPYRPGRKEELLRRIKMTGTIKKGSQIEHLSNYTETTIWNPKTSPNHPFQYSISVTTKSGAILNVRSNKTLSIREGREQAEDRIYRMLAKKFANISDADIGKDLLEDENLIIRRQDGVVYYKKIS